MATPSRTMLSYLLLPRAGDTVKWLILPVAFAVGSAARGLPGPNAIVAAIVVWLALELLVYQARYQWNDIRGFSADQAHPDGDRGRLPGPIECHQSRVRVSAAVAVLKVCAAVALCAVIVDVQTGILMALLAAGVFGIAAIYEGLKKVATGVRDEVPVPLSAGVVAIWVVVGAGYALRAMTGLGLAIVLMDPSWLPLMAAVACWLFGIAWVTSRWAVESTALAVVERSGVRWLPSGARGREHQLALARWLPRRAGREPDARHWAAVRLRTPWTAPWNIAGAMAAAAAAACGPALTQSEPSPLSLLACSALGAGLGATLLAAGRLREWLLAPTWSILLLLYWLVGTVDPLLATLAWLVIAIAQACYLRQDRASLGMFLRRRSSSRPAARSRRAGVLQGGA